LSDGEGRVFLITGASSGIGEATARQAAAAGYRVVLAARSTEKLELLAEELGGLAVTCDVTEWADQEASMGESARLELNGTGVRVTLIEPGMVDTPFFDERPVGMLEPDDIARAVLFAITQPPHVDVNEILVRPTTQST